MNPILLKPESDLHSQVVIKGQVWDSLQAIDYYSRKDYLWQAVTESMDQLKSRYDLVIMEGAGSPAEINLMKNDIVNLAAARYAGAPCLLAGDIDRGGVFAQLLGTLWLLEEADRRMIRGLIVNKFRGDLNLFSEGLLLLEEKSGIPVLGVVPYIHNHGIAEEDAATINDVIGVKAGKDIVVIHLPHISNYDDLDPLKAEPEVNIRFIDRTEQLGKPAVIILPGTKNTLQDMLWLHENGLSQKIRQLAARGTAVVGLCGGFQMLCESIRDESAVESRLIEVPGLGLLPGITRFMPTKTVTRSQARISSSNGFLARLSGQCVAGYEIHMGQTSSPNSFNEITSREGQPVSSRDGSFSSDGRIWGTYLHGIFENDNLREAWLESLGIQPLAIPYQERRIAAYDRLADVLEGSLNIPLLDRIIEEGI